ncbi:MAG TPA: hypothetical protein VJB57_14510 [Dehalococcoidia bacterium]|nr:hypothetical protein [Dehalococcoidia bacterium]
MTTATSTTTPTTTTTQQCESGLLVTRVNGVIVSAVVSPQCTPFVRPPSGAPPPPPPPPPPAPVVQQQAPLVSEVQGARTDTPLVSEVLSSRITPPNIGDAGLLSKPTPRPWRWLVLVAGLAGATALLFSVQRERSQG